MGGPNMSKTLVLNASYEPLAVVPLQRAIALVLSQKAMALEVSDTELHSEHLCLAAPSVVLLRHFVRVAYRATLVPLSRRAVLRRDHGRCAYCEKTAETVDHVVPKSRGGLNRWENVVAACYRCNHRKADRLLSEIGWSLPTSPGPPAWSRLATVIGEMSAHPAWEHYLEGWRVGGSAVDVAS